MGTSEPTWRLSAVGSKPQYRVRGPDARRAASASAIGAVVHESPLIEVGEKVNSWSGHSFIVAPPGRQVQHETVGRAQQWPYPPVGVPDDRQ